MPATNIAVDKESRHQKLPLISPVDIPTITASTNKASRQVITVAPIETLTARFLVTPYLLTIG